MDLARYKAIVGLGGCVTSLKNKRVLHHQRRISRAFTSRIALLAFCPSPTWAGFTLEAVSSRFVLRQPGLPSCATIAHPAPVLRGSRRIRCEAVLNAVALVCLVFHDKLHFPQSISFPGMQRWVNACFVLDTSCVVTLHGAFAFGDVLVGHSMQCVLRSINVATQRRTKRQRRTASHPA